MPIDPLIQSLFDRVPALAKIQSSRISPDEARSEFKKLCQFANPDASPIGKIENIEAGSTENPIPLRIYTPVAAGGSALPALVYFHGGGFVLGDLDCYDPLCRALANDSGCRLVSVGYRLAPEHPFPAAVEDCLAAVQWVESNAAALGLDPNRVAVGGDSAGGNLAAVVCQLAKAKGAPHIAFQLLIYPIVALRRDLPAALAIGAGYLGQPTVDWFYAHYVPKDADPDDLRLSPLKADDFAGLPPAYVVTAGFDPLRDEGIAYAEKLKAAGVAVSHIDYPTMIHGFFSMQGIVPLSGEAVTAAAHAVRDAI